MKAAQPSDRVDPDYEARKQEWIARQLENCPPLTDAAKSIIRTAFAAHHAEMQAGAA